MRTPSLYELHIERRLQRKFAWALIANTVLLLAAALVITFFVEA